MKGNNNAILIYEKKNGSHLIWKCKDGSWWWKSWVHERRRQEDRSSPQKALMPNSSKNCSPNMQYNNRIIVDVKNEERALPYKEKCGGGRLLTTNMG